jgi:hypothetical protein
MRLRSALFLRNALAALSLPNKVCNSICYISVFWILAEYFEEVFMLKFRSEEESLTGVSNVNDIIDEILNKKQGNTYAFCACIQKVRISMLRSKTNFFFWLDYPFIKKASFEYLVRTTKMEQI